VVLPKAGEGITGYPIHAGGCDLLNSLKPKKGVSVLQAADRKFYGRVTVTHFGDTATPDLVEKTFTKPKRFINYSVKQVLEAEGRGRASIEQVTSSITVVDPNSRAYQRTMERIREVGRSGVLVDAIAALKPHVTKDGQSLFVYASRLAERAMQEVQELRQDVKALERACTDLEERPVAIENSTGVFAPVHRPDPWILRVFVGEPPPISDEDHIKNLFCGANPGVAQNWMEGVHTRLEAGQASETDVATLYSLARVLLGLAVAKADQATVLEDERVLGDGAPDEAALEDDLITMDKARLEQLLAQFEAIEAEVEGSRDTLTRMFGPFGKESRSAALEEAGEPIHKPTANHE